MVLRDKVAIVTGSTSGIGLGIASKLAEAGADIMLNGFASPADIDALQSKLTHEFRVRVAFSSADMSKPAEVAGMVEQATPRRENLPSSCTGCRRTEFNWSSERTATQPA